MSWKIVYTSRAREDLRNIFEYISNELCAPDTAVNQTRRIMQSIRSLDDNPIRNRQFRPMPVLAIPNLRTYFIGPLISLS